MAIFEQKRQFLKNTRGTFQISDNHGSGKFEWSAKAKERQILPAGGGTVTPTSRNDFECKSLWLVGVTVAIDGVAIFVWLRWKFSVASDWQRLVDENKVNWLNSWRLNIFFHSFFDSHSMFRNRETCALFLWTVTRINDSKFEAVSSCRQVSHSTFGHNSVALRFTYEIW